MANALKWNFAPTVLIGLFAMLVANAIAQTAPANRAAEIVTGTPATRPALAPANAAASNEQSIYGSMLQDDGNTTGPFALEAGTYAVFHTSDGDFLVRLHTDKAPKTVQNFLELASGRKPWKHPVTLVESNRPLYNNTTVYRIIPNSMIFGGDPINKGTGDSGGLLPLECSADLKFDQPGQLAMDGNGTQASGSRWFVTLRPFPDRSSNYTIFGKVVGGLGVVRTISNKPTRKPQSPLDPTLLSSIEAIEIPAGKRTMASFATEDGRQVLSIDRNFTDAAPPTPLPATADAATTATDATTTTSVQTTATLSR